MTIMFDLAVILWGEINFFFFLHSLEWNNFMYRLNTPIESRQITFSNIAVILRTDLKACTKKRCAYGSLCWTSFVLLSNGNLSLHDEKEKKKPENGEIFFFFFWDRNKIVESKILRLPTERFKSIVDSGNHKFGKGNEPVRTHVICTMCRKFVIDFWSDTWLVDLILEVVFDQSDCRWASDIEGKSAQRAQETLYSLVWFEMFLLFLLLNDS